MALRMLEDSTVKSLYKILSESNLYEKENFEDVVKRDFKLFLLDKYDDENYKDVSEDDVNEYFTGMFYDIQDENDLEDANNAEAIIRKEYGLEDKFEESVNLKEDINKITDENYDEAVKYINAIESSIRAYEGDRKYHGGYTAHEYKFQKQELRRMQKLMKEYKKTINESAKPLNEGGIYPVEIDEEANQALVDKLAEILGCDSSEDISVDNLELIPAKGFGGGGQYWFRAQVNIGKAAAYHGGFIWKALEAVKDQCPHLYKIYKNGTQSSSVATGETSGLEVNYYSTIDIKDDEEVENGLSFEYSNEDLDLAGCDLETLEAEEIPVGDYLCNLVKEHMSELIELLKSYEISEDDYEDTDDAEEYNESAKLKEAKNYLNEPNNNIYNSVMIDVEELEPIPVCYNLNKSMTSKEITDYINKYGYELDSIGKEVSEKELKSKTFNCNFESITNTDKPMDESLTEGSRLYIYSNAESEDKSDAQSMIWSTYKPEAPKLNFQIHKEGRMYFVDFIGSEEDIRNYLIKLGWFTPEEIDKYDLIKPYTPEHHDKNEDLTESNSILTKENRKRFEEIDKKISEKNKKIRSNAGSQAVMLDDLPEDIYNEDYYKNVCGLTDEEYKFYVDYNNAIDNHLEEAKKPKKKKDKKPEERIIMQQGNVTCLKQGDKYKVFEEAEDENLKEYSNQEEAMKDALSRCGVDPDNELAESIETKAYNMLKENKNYEDFYKELKNKFDDDKLIPAWNKAIKKLSE